MQLKKYEDAWSIAGRYWARLYEFSGKHNEWPLGLWEIYIQNKYFALIHLKLRKLGYRLELFRN